MNAEILSIRRLFLPVLSALLMSCRPGADFKVSVRVIDEATGQPIPDAWVLAAVAVKVEPEREPPYNRAVAGARAKTDRRGIATFKDIQGIYWGEEPQDKLWLMLESRKPKVKRRITLLKEGDLFVFAEDYGAMHHPLHFKGTPQEHAGMGPFGIKGEDKAILLDPTELKDGAIVTIKMAKPDNEYLYGSFHPDTFLPAIWAATSKKTGATKAEKRAIYDFFVRNLAPLDRDRPEGADRGRIKPEALLDPEVTQRFVNHAPARDQGTAVQEWMTQKALELLPPGYEEVKEYAQEILAGVREEEEGDRPLNHYYDPSDPERALPGGETALKWGAIGYPDNPRNEWDWQDALRYYRTGQKAMAYRALGHVAHLLADLSSPLHTRVAQKDAAARGHSEDYARRLTDLARANGGTLPRTRVMEERMPNAIRTAREIFEDAAEITFQQLLGGHQAMDGDEVLKWGDSGPLLPLIQMTPSRLAPPERVLLPLEPQSVASLYAHFSAQVRRQLSVAKMEAGTSLDALPEAPQSLKPSQQGGGQSERRKPLNNSDIRSYEKGIAAAKEVLAEYRQGIRDDEDAYGAIRDIIRFSRNLGVADTLEIGRLREELDRLISKHPEFMRRTTESSDRRRQREEWGKRESERQEELNAWKPLDERPMAAYFFQRWVLAVYQYRLEFFEGPEGGEYPLEFGHPMSASELPAKLIGELKEGKAKRTKTIRFQHGINYHPTFPVPGNRFLLACGDKFGEYMPSSGVERELVGRSRRWEDMNADIKEEACLVLSIDGKESHRFLIRSAPPEAFVQPLGVAPDGSMALFGEGHAEVDEERAGGWYLARCRTYLIWNESEAIRPLALDKISSDMSLRLQNADLCPL